MDASADRSGLVRFTADVITRFRDGLDDRAVFPPVDEREVRDALGASMPAVGTAASTVIDDLVRIVEPHVVASAGPRYFGFVTGGSLDAPLCADLLVTGWDQNAFNAVTSPIAAIVEDVAGRWLIDLFGLPAAASFGFVTGGQGANTAGLAAARHHLLASCGWDVEADGMVGAPAITVVASVERHATIDRSLRLLGLGRRCLREVQADANGAIDVDALGAALADVNGPTIVCLQAGNVNTGACDDLARACDVAHRAGAWVHVDGAFGLWAATNPATASLTAGLERADSWATDGHKWLNVPYDCGYVFCSHPEVHRDALSMTAAYLMGSSAAGLRAPSDFVVESSRRARGLATYAALRELGRAGIAEMVERSCRLARLFATRLGAVEGIAIGNDVVLNQVLVCFGNDDRTDAVAAAVQASRECWMGVTTWRGRRYMRISLSGWGTTDTDVDRSVAAVLAAHARV
ncbi:MAG: aspartate aminotransferase family protein [Acidimicrobiia bacterium]